MTSIRLECPKMTIDRETFKLRRTAAEPMLATILFDDASFITIPAVVIPPTQCRRVSALNWMVDPCEGRGALAGNELVVSLPKEPVTWALNLRTMVARSITAPVTFRRATG